MQRRFAQRLTSQWTISATGSSGLSSRAGSRSATRPTTYHLGLDAYTYHLITVAVPKPKPDAFLPLKSNWFHILICLVEGEQHGYGIMQDGLERSGGKVRLWPATLYGSLKRLIEKGLIAESGERPAPELDDARRRYYKLTPLGRQVLDLESQRLKDLVRVLDARRRQEARS